MHSKFNGTLAQAESNTRRALLRVTSLLGWWLLAASAPAQTANLAEAPAQQKGFNLLQVYADIEQLEYEIKWQDSVGTYQVPNRAHNLRLSFYSNGFTAEPRDPIQDKEKLPEIWKASFALASTSPGRPFTPVAQPRVELRKNTAKFVFDEVDVDYLNDTNGLQQTFLIKNKPEGDRLELRLRVTLEHLRMDLDPTGQFVVFHDPVSDEEVLRYSGLRVFDATGQELPAALGLEPPSTITIRVDDTGAKYPVLIDPWVTHPSSTAPTNQTGAQFGFSVAYCERFDININNYQGSLIVGAPYYDEGSADQGKVFAFLPQGTGTNTAFSLVSFQVKGELAYSYFGHSLAVAQPYDFPDVSQPHPTFQSEANPLADLIVGAPGTDQGKGKVYVYYGTNLSTKPFGNDYRSANRSYNGSIAGANLGWSVAAGDVTGDGYQELFIGMPNYASGEVQIYKSTSAGLPTSPH